MHTNKRKATALLMSFDTINTFEEQILIALKDTKHVQEKDKTALVLEILDALHEIQTTVFEMPKAYLNY